MINQKSLDSLFKLPFAVATAQVQVVGEGYGREYQDALCAALFAAAQK